MTDIPDDLIWAMTTCLFHGDLDGITELHKQDRDLFPAVVTAAAVVLGNIFRDTVTESMGLDAEAAWRRFREACQT